MQFRCFIANVRTSEMLAEIQRTIQSDIQMGSNMCRSKEIDWVILQTYAVSDSSGSCDGGGGGGGGGSSGSSSSSSSNKPHVQALHFCLKVNMQESCNHILFYKNDLKLHECAG